MKALCLIVWMFITLLLVFTVIGMLLFVGKTVNYESGSPDIYKSTWMEMGNKLLDSVLEQS